LAKNHHGLVGNSMNQRRLNRLRANPIDDSSDSKIVARLPVLSSELPQLIFQISVGMFLLSAPLGMLLDNYHGKC
jgi:hypothetical protein